MTKRFISSLFLILFILPCSFSQSNEISITGTYSGEKFQIEGELGVGFGNLVTIEGLIVEGPWKGYEGGPNIIVQKIADSTFQNVLRIPLKPFRSFSGKFEDGEEPKIEIGKTFKLRVYETGSFEGVPWEAYNEYGDIFQTVGYYFRNELKVLSSKEIQNIEFQPSDFIDRNGLFAGKAISLKGQAYIAGKGWKIKLPANFQWDQMEVNKDVEIYGKVGKTNETNIFIVIGNEPRLINLNDQLGQQVKLRGTARSMNGHWWFNYRGVDLYVEDMENLPKWSDDNHWRAIEISGLLTEAEKNRIDQLTLKTNPDKKLYYFIKNPAWKPIDGLLFPEVAIDDLKSF